MAKKAAPNIDWSKLGFGFSDVNCHIRYTWKNGKWSKPSFVKEPAITMHIGASCLHRPGLQRDRAEKPRRLEGVLRRIELPPLRPGVLRGD